MLTKGRPQRRIAIKVVIECLVGIKAWPTEGGGQGPQPVSCAMAQAKQKVFRSLRDFNVMESSVSTSSQQDNSTVWNGESITASDVLQ